jgi:hypothetical protein
MSQKVIVKYPSDSKKAEITVDSTKTAEDLIQWLIAQWKLPSDAEYSLANITSGKSIVPAQALSEDIVKGGDTLEVQPVLVAG